jgi:general secretion pathway protein A
MYAPFFGLSKEPFAIAPDPRFLYMSEQHREALAHLLYGLQGGGGFVLLTGEIGAGKTTVCRAFLEQLPPHCAVAYVFNPRLSAIELLQTVCGEFGLPPPQPEGSVKAHVDALNAFLLAAHAEGRQAVLIIDEAQSLDPAVLEQLRLLTNLETAERKLLQIVLIGQPELREMLARPDLEQLAQRVIARFHLGALSAAQTPAYVRHRLAVAGMPGALPFSDAALARLHALSRGVPRRVNLLADRTLLGAYAQGRPRAERSTVEQAAREVFGSAEVARRSPWPVLGTLAAGSVAVALVLAWAVTRPTPTRASSAAAAPASAASPVMAARATAPPAAASAVSSAPVDPQAWLAAAPTSPAQAWRELALRWNVAIGEGEPCAAVAQARLACYRSASGGLALVRQLGRPGIVTLRGGGAPVHALLVALDEQGATLQVGTQRQTMTLPALVALWPGDFSTFWRTPPGWRDGAEADPALSARLDTQLAAAGHAPGRPLAERIRAFQRAQGLPDDGVAGPLTWMRLGRAAGLDEPRLGAS